MKADHRVQLIASIDCIRWLLQQGLPLHEYDGSYGSSNEGKFIELLKFLADENEDLSKAMMRNAHENLQLTSPSIQKDIVNAMVNEITSLVIEDLGDELFGILVDDSIDISWKEHVILFIRYVDAHGHIIERLLGVIHVCDITSLSFKVAIEDLLTKHGLSISRIRSQGYNGASSMRCGFNGLKTLILNENSSAFYVHCFAHQLRQALVAAAKENLDVGMFFMVATQMCYIVCASCKHSDKLQNKQLEMLIELVSLDKILTTIDLNLESTLKRHGDIYWRSHYGVLVSIVDLFSVVIDIVEEVSEDTGDVLRVEALLTLREIDFDFVFFLHLMKNVLGITDELSQALQMKDQNITSVMRLVDVSKQKLQQMRDGGWEALLEEVSLFCNKHDVLVPNMDKIYVASGRSRRKIDEKTNLQRYVERFYAVLDLQLQELNNWFNDKTTELLLCVSCFDPRNSFARFNKEKLVQLAKLYPNDFNEIEVEMLDNQLQTYIMDVSSDPDFSKLVGIDELTQKMVETGRHLDYTFVYLLLKLVLILPVVNASVERACFAMKIINTSLYNWMSDDLLVDCLVPYFEKDILDRVSNEKILQQFQNMSKRG